MVSTIPEPPTAVHWIAEKHESDSTEKSGSWIDQLDPPSVDLMIPEPPPA
jgi:hypothetical protein